MATTYCTTHPTKQAASTCFNCKRPFCRACLTIGGDYYFCRMPDCQRAVLNAPKSDPNRDIDEIDRTGFMAWNFRQKNMPKTAKAFTLGHVLWRAALFVAVILLGIALSIHYAQVTVPVILVLVAYMGFKRLRKR